MMQKRCRECGAIAPIQAQFCGGCRHKLRTQFAGTDQTQVMPTSPRTVASPPAHAIIALLPPLVDHAMVGDARPEVPCTG